MKKLTLSLGKAVAFLVFVCLFLIQSCKKDLLMPNSGTLGKSISIEEAKNYFQQNVVKLKINTKFSSTSPIKTGEQNATMDDQMPMWDASQLKDLSIGTNAVLTPLYRPGVYIHISEKRMVSYGFLNYLMMHKDADDNIITEWVELLPSEKWIDAKFTRKYDGKIIVKDWDGKVKKIYFFKDGEIVVSSKLKKSMLASTNGKVIASTNPGIICYVTKTLTVVTKPTTCPCLGHTFEQIASCDCNVKPTHSFTKSYKLTTEFDCDIPDEPIDPPAGATPGGTGSNGNGGSSGSGGSTNPNDYAPSNCNSDPNATIPNTPPPPGTQYILLCSAFNIPTEAVLIPDGNALPEVEPKTPAQTLVNWFNSDPDLGLHISIAEETFLNNNPIIANELLDNLASESLETKKLGNWAVEYLTANPQGFNQAFRDLLTGVYNENSPVYIPRDFDIEYSQDWYAAENELAAIGTKILQQGVHDTDPVPEMYYKNGIGIDMRPAPPKNGLTIKNAPRNKDYFWKELAAKKPEMFSAANRAKLALPRPLAPIIDEQWVKYNPTHKSYIGGKLIHHHDEQDYMAFAIPEKVHQKWTKILHDYELRSKIPSLRGTVNSLVSVMQIFSIVTDVRTSNPDSWVNWFAQMNEKGKIYPDPANNKYWEIMDQTLYKNSAGEVVRAVVHYNVYADYVWDADEHRYMGVIKLNEFTEDVDLINKTSKEVVRKWL